ncbi:MAG: patatin-like phospholipase family protein [Elusimicrobia bacterium]|nr:patatin-like phospholipase family protein [Elusimicrobiota bacterium]
MNDSTLLRRPLGLVLAGGGALGAWQAGCLEALARAGLVFDKVLGFSAGALAGATYALDRLDDLLAFYRDVDWTRFLRPRPSFSPPYLFSDSTLRETLRPLSDEAAAMRELRCEVFVMSLRLRDRATVYSRFTPGGRLGWDGPLVERLLASSAIPFVFPPVRIEDDGGPSWHVDGGIAGRELMRLDCLAGCRDIVVVEMVRPEEPLMRTWSLPLYFKLCGRRVCRAQTDHAVATALAGFDPPRVLRLCPSRMLDFTMLGFSRGNCLPAIELGRRDAARFLGDPAQAEARGLAPSGQARPVSRP